MNICAFDVNLFEIFLVKSLTAKALVNVILTLYSTPTRNKSQHKTPK